MEQRTQEIQGRVSDVDNLVGLGILDVSGPDPNESGLPQLTGEGDTEKVEERLSALKRELG